MRGKSAQGRVSAVFGGCRRTSGSRGEGVGGGGSRIPYTPDDARFAASADHNMNSQGTEGKAQHFPFPSFPPFPFMPRDLPSHPLSINLTGALGAAEESEDSATSSPNSGEGEKEDKKEEEDLAFAHLPPVQSVLGKAFSGIH